MDTVLCVQVCVMVCAGMGLCAWGESVGGRYEHSTGDMCVCQSLCRACVCAPGCVQGCVRLLAGGYACAEMFAVGSV